MNSRQAKKFRKELNKAVIKQVKKENWSFMKSVEEMTFRQRLGLAWKILWIKPEKEVDGAAYYEKMKKEHNSDSDEKTIELSDSP